MPSRAIRRDAAAPQAKRRRAATHHRRGRLAVAERELRAAVRSLRRTNDRRSLARVLCQLGSVVREQGRYRAAARLLREAVSAAGGASADRVQVAIALNEYGVCCKYLGRFADAGQAYQRALQIFERRYGHDHEHVATVYHNLGGLEHAAGNWARGEPFARESVRIRRRLLGDSHPAVAADLTALAALLDRQQAFTAAERLYRGAIAIQTRAFGPDHAELCAAYNNLAALLQATRRPRQAEALYRRTLAIEIASHGPDHPNVGFCLNNLSSLLLARHRLDEAAILCRRALTIFRQRLGPHHPHTAVCLENYAAILRQQGRRRHADRYSRRASRILAGVDAVNDAAVAVTATINPLRAGYQLRVGPSRVHRYGVFAEEAIPARQRVIEYTGERIARVESARRWNPARSYLFNLDDYWRIDGAIGGSGAEIINHSCDPNLVTRIRRGRIFYFSKRRIAEGEELTVDYKYEAELAPMPCRCGAASCRGTMNVPRQRA